MRWFAGLVAAAAYLYLVGFLKGWYYARAFGLSPEALGATPASTLLESWYVAQNLIYLTLVVLCCWKLRSFVWTLLAVVYALIPLTAHYLIDTTVPLLQLYTSHAHTMMKFLPALFVLAAWRGGTPPAPRRPSWAIALLLIGSWGISAAKHFGSADALRVQRQPQLWLAQLETADAHFLLQRTAEGGWIWIAEGRGRLEFWPLERLNRQRLRPPGSIQPGAQFL